MLAFAQLVIFVPGYGMAVARAQHEVKELADELEKRGVTVEYAIHPVAGRMPGHMNVLLAEANVPYPQLKEMDAVNGDFPRADVAVVIGANDVVNPQRARRANSPIFGMPILNADEAKTVVVLKRSMATGFAGVDNPLVLQAEHPDALRRRAHLSGVARRRGQEAVGGAFPVEATLRNALSRSAGAVSLTT